MKMADIVQWAELQVTEMMQNSINQVNAFHFGDSFNDPPLPIPDRSKIHGFGMDLRVKLQEYMTQDFKPREDLAPIIEKIGNIKTSTGVDLAYTLALLLDRKREND